MWATKAPNIKVSEYICSIRKGFALQWKHGYIRSVLGYWSRRRSFFFIPAIFCAAQYEYTPVAVTQSSAQRRLAIHRLAYIHTQMAKFMGVTLAIMVVCIYPKTVTIKSPYAVTIPVCYESQNQVGHNIYLLTCFDSSVPGRYGNDNQNIMVNPFSLQLPPPPPPLCCHIPLPGHKVREMTDLWSPLSSMD